MTEFIVLRKSNYDGWRVITESCGGVDFQTADRIRNYYVEVKGQPSDAIRIVELKEMAVDATNRVNLKKAA